MNKVEPYIPPLLPPKIDHLELIKDIGDAREEMSIYPVH